MPDNELPITRWVHAEPEILAVQVTADHARGIAAWCGGWACDDLRWNELIGCYHRPEDDPEYPSAMFQSLDKPAPGGVMMSFGFPARVGDWVYPVTFRGKVHFTYAVDGIFRDMFRPVQTDG